MVCVDDGETKSKEAAAKPRRAPAKAKLFESVEPATAKDKEAKDNLAAAHKALTAALAAVKDASAEACKAAVALAVAKATDAAKAEAPKKRRAESDEESEDAKAPRLAVQVKIEKAKELQDGAEEDEEVNMSI